MSFQDLPDNIQLYIWDISRKLLAKEIIKVTDDDSYRKLKILVSSERYCGYMRNMKKFDLKMLRRKPISPYKPNKRRCEVCGDLEIYIGEPVWKKKCTSCWREDQMKKSTL